MKYPHAKTKTHRDNTNTPTCSNTSAPPTITRSSQTMPTLKHEITNNSQFRQILYKKHNEILSASLRSNKPKHGSAKTHDQSVLAAPTKLTLCRRTQKTKPMDHKNAQWRLRTRATYVHQSHHDGAPPRRQNQTATFFGNNNGRAIH